MRVEAEVRRRSAEVGALLAEARQAQRRSITECAELIGTSRKRYRNIEAGAAEITFVELEALVQYLSVPISMLWPQIQDKADHYITLQAKQGETLRLTVKIINL